MNKYQQQVKDSLGVASGEVVTEAVGKFISMRVDAALLNYEQVRVGKAIDKINDLEDAYQAVSTIANIASEFVMNGALEMHINMAIEEALNAQLEDLYYEEGK